MLKILHFDIFELQETKLPVRLIDTTNERRQVQGHETTLRVKGNIEDMFTVNWKNDGDEAHFWLNGYVKKQNCRIWSEANPQVYVETPLHPEKLTVWCALWAGGILLQKR
ncbi:hypothetical protein TNCV_4694551 [Trichonephila clavipes]|nr:hypothetical protein TNCV_4694551 [Trichonephila clavipes]